MRDQLLWGSIERLLIELHTCALGRSREYAAVRLQTQPPSKEQRRHHPNYCVLQPSNPAGSYLRLGSSKTSNYIQPYIQGTTEPLIASLYHDRAETAAASTVLDCLNNQLDPAIRSPTQTRSINTVTAASRQCLDGL